MEVLRGNGTRFFAQSPLNVPIPLPCLGDVYQQLHDQNWSVESVVPVGAVAKGKMIDPATGQPQGLVPAFALIISKVKQSGNKPEFPTIKLQW